MDSLVERLGCVERCCGNLARCTQLNQCQALRLAPSFRGFRIYDVTSGTWHPTPRPASVGSTANGPSHNRFKRKLAYCPPAKKVAATFHPADIHRVLDCALSSHENCSMRQVCCISPASLVDASTCSRYAWHEIQSTTPALSSKPRRKTHTVERSSRAQNGAKSISKVKPSS